MSKRSLFAVIVIALMACLSVPHQEYEAEGAMPARSPVQASHIMVTPESIKWDPLAPGMSVKVLSGSPSAEGSPFVLRIKLDDGTKVPPHWHPVDEHLTVISGTFFMGMGEKFNEEAMKEMTAGSYTMMPKEMRHFASVKGETIVQINGIGPFKTIMVGAAESPK